MAKKTSFELLPEDLQGYICSFVDFKDVLELQCIGTNLKHVRMHIEHITIKNTKINVDKLCTLIGNKLKTLILSNNQIGYEEINI